MIELLRRNLGLKLFALVLAYIVWAHVVGRDQTVGLFEVPLDFEAPADVIVVSYEPRQVDVKVRGDAAVINRMSEQRLLARIVIPSDAPRGPQEVELSEDQILNLPRGVTVEEIEGTVHFVLESRATKTVRVKPILVGQPAPGHEVGRVITEPSIVTITGPASVVAEIESVETERVDVSRRTGDGEVTAGLLRPAAGKRHVEILGRGEVRVAYEIEGLSRPLTLERPVVAPEGWQASPGSVTVELSAPPGLADALREGLRVSVSAEGVAPEGGEAAPQVELDALTADQRERVEVIEVTPPQLRLRPQR
jgi:hypothetical protein